jgi:hypothetical protein
MADDKDEQPKDPASTPPATPSARPAERKSVTTQVLLIAIPALVALGFMFQGTIEKRFGHSEGNANDSDAVKNARAFHDCVNDALLKNTTSKDKGKLEFGEVKTDKDREDVVEHANLTPDERKSVFEACASFFDKGIGSEAVARLSLVEGDHNDPVTKDVRVAIEAGSRYVDPNRENGEAQVPYLPSTCGKEGCAVRIEPSSAYELVEPMVLDKATLARGVPVKLRRKNESLAIALGAHAGTPYIWIEGTNGEAVLWNPNCQPNDDQPHCRQVQAMDGNATFRARGKLTSLTYKLSADGDSWGDSTEIADAASLIKDGILRLPAPAPAPARRAGPACVKDAAWFKNSLRQFTGWKDTRKLKLSAVVGAGGLENLQATPALTPDERSALLDFVHKPASAVASCAKTPVSADISARAQH